MIHDCGEKVWKKSTPLLPDISLIYLHPKLSIDMNEKLMAPYTAGEVKKVLFSIGDLKAQGQLVYILSFTSDFGPCLVMT